MFDTIFTPEKLLLIAAVALIFVGPKRLPQIGRSLGRWLGDFRRATSGMADELKTGLNDAPPPPAAVAPPPAAPAVPAVQAPEAAKEPGPPAAP